jgi:hypothetical protein
MAYTSFSFPASTPLFPHASVVLQYLNDYADHFHLNPHIRPNSTVKSVERDLSNSHWNVTISSTASHASETLPFDLILVCNGHYRVPRYPNIPGLAQWLRTGKATHSAYYRRPHHTNQTVLVIGNGPSGNDISSEVRSSARTVIHSATGAAHEDTGNLKRRGRVSHFFDAGVMFEDGTTELGIDHCILATGYELSFPFLSNDIIAPTFPPPVPPLPRTLHNTTYSVFPLAKHLFPFRNLSTIAFPGLLVQVAPFPIFELQTLAIMHAFAHPESLDTTQEAVDIMTRHEELRVRLGSDDLFAIMKEWHRFEPLEQFEYRKALCEFVFGSQGEKRWDVKEWEKEMYLNKDVLRKAWVELEKQGEAVAWVGGVGEEEGEKGRMEWVGVMKRMLAKL